MESCTAYAAFLFLFFFITKRRRRKENSIYKLQLPYAYRISRLASYTTWHAVHAWIIESFYSIFSLLLLFLSFDSTRLKIIINYVFMAAKNSVIAIAVAFERRVCMKAEDKATSRMCGAAKCVFSIRLKQKEKCFWWMLWLATTHKIYIFQYRILYKNSFSLFAVQVITFRICACGAYIHSSDLMRNWWKMNEPLIYENEISIQWIFVSLPILSKTIYLLPPIERVKRGRAPSSPVLHAYRNQMNLLWFLSVTKKQYLFHGVSR